MRLDVVMWAKNGAATLPIVLRRVEKCLPKEFVHRKILVDDHSTDDSEAIAGQFDWEVHKNEEGGVAAGVSKAFSLVDCEYFVSIEQDLLLASNWWNRISAALERPDVAVAQGWRLPPEAQLTLRRFEEYRLEHYKKYGLPIFSIDNTIFRSSVVKRMGIVPSELKYSGVDTYVYKNITSLGYRWAVDYDLISTHLRQGGVREQVNRYYRYGLDTPILEKHNLSSESKYIHQGVKSVLAILLFSPFRAFPIAVTKRCPQIMLYYPLIRFALLKGYLESGA